MGTYYERLVRAYLKNDPLEQEQFEEIWTYPEWARKHDFDPHDTGSSLLKEMFLVLILMMKHKRYEV